MSFCSDTNKIQFQKQSQLYTIYTILYFTGQVPQKNSQKVFRITSAYPAWRNT